MFQNIVQEEKIEDVEEIINDKPNIKENLKKLFNKQNILVYILSFMLSGISTLNGMTPFGIAILAAVLANGLPGGIVFIVSLIAMLIENGGAAALSYVFTTLVFIAMVVIFKPWYADEYKSERRKLGKYVLFSTIIVNLVELFFKGFLLYDLFFGITSAVVAYIFYKIFANSLIAVSEFGVKKAFTVEEVVGASLMLGIAITCLRDLQIFGLEIKNVLCILIVLVLGWKKGILIRRDKRYNDWCSAWNNWRRTTNFCCIFCSFSE